MGGEFEERMFFHNFEKINFQIGFPESLSQFALSPLNHRTWF